MESPDPAFASDDSLFRRLLESAPDAMLIVNASGTILLVNAQAERVFGYSREELVGQPVEILIPVQSRSQHRGDRNTYSVAPQARQMNAGLDLRGLRKSGEEFPAEISLSPIDTESGILVISAIRDVTDRRRLERAFQETNLELVRQRAEFALLQERSHGLEALRAAEERMRFALEASHVGIWDMDYTTGVLRWSDVLEALYGLPHGTFGGTFEAFVACIHPDDRTAVLETVGNAMKSGADFSVLNRAIWPDGTVRWLSGAGRVQLGEHGEPLRAVGISWDVTELRRHYDEVESQRDTVFRATMTTVMDILNNFLTSMQLVRLEADQQLSPDTLALFDRLILHATAELTALGNVENVRLKEMEIGPGIEY